MIHKLRRTSAHFRARFAGRVDNLTSVPQRLFGLAIVRIGVGIAQLSLYTTNYLERRTLYGAQGIYPREYVDQSGGPNLYVLTGESSYAFEILYHAGMLACIALVAGVGGRLTVMATWATSWSLWYANPFLIDGGDNLCMVLLPMLLMSRCMDRLSLRTSVSPARRWRALGDHWLAILLSNLVGIAIMIQICLVYFLSGIYKFAGDMWFEGTALYYILRTPEYFYPPLAPIVLDSDMLIVVGTYLAMISLVAFPFVVLSRRLRPWAVAGMLSFHLGIAVMMGLTSFALIMAACDCMFVSSDLERLWNRARDAWRRRKAWRPVQTVPRRAEAPKPSTEPTSVPRLVRGAVE